MGNRRYDVKSGLFRAAVLCFFFGSHAICFWNVEMLHVGSREDANRAMIRVNIAKHVNL